MFYDGHLVGEPDPECTDGIPVVDSTVRSNDCYAGSMIHSAWGSFGDEPDPECTDGIPVVNSTVRSDDGYAGRGTGHTSSEKGGLQDISETFNAIAQLASLIEDKALKQALMLEVYNGRKGLNKLKP